MGHALAQTLLTIIADLPLLYLPSLLPLLIQILLMFTKILAFLARLGTITIIAVILLQQLLVYLILALESLFYLSVSSFLLFSL